MRFLSFLILFLTSYSVFGQEVIKKTNDVTFLTTEEYYVLKSDKKIKHGAYKELYDKSKVLISGHYSNGIKDSVWEFYKFNGEQLMRYDFTQSKLLYVLKDEKEFNKKYRILKGTDLIDTVLEQPPLYIGDKYMFIGMNVQYPAEAMEKNIQGQVMLQFSISKNGDMGDISIINSNDPSLEKEALRVASLLDKKWVPGVLNGEPVTVIYEMPVTFKLR
jgi:protein TonB